MARPHCVIVGAGPAGVRAAETLVAAGLRPVLVDEAPRGGGQIYRRQPPSFRRSGRDLYGSEAAKAAALHATLEALQDRIDYRPEALVWNVRDGRVHILKDSTTYSLPYDALIIASGATDRIFPLPGWTMPGVYTLGAAQIALKAQACAIGERVAFLGSGPLLYLVAYQYLKAGAGPVAVLDTASWGQRLAGSITMASRPRVLLNGLGYMLALARAGVALHSGITPLACEGSGAGVTGLRFRSAGGRERQVACDAVGFGYHLRAETQLADLASVPFAYDNRLSQWMPECDTQGRSAVPGVYLAGDGAQLAGADGAEVMGRLAALAALADHGHPVDAAEVGRLLALNHRMRRFRDGIATAFAWPGARLARQLPDETIVCRCEAITAATLRRTARELGAPEVNRAKALSRVGMGRCQGRFCGLASAEIVAAALDVPTAQVGRLRGQAPVKPLPAGVVEGGT